MKKPFTVTQYQCTVETSFDLIESTYYRIRDAIDHNPARADLLTPVAHQLFDVWQDKVRIELAPSLAEDIFFKILTNAIKFQIWWFKEQQLGQPDKLDFLFIRRLFLYNMDELLETCKI